MLLHADDHPHPLIGAILRGMGKGVVAAIRKSQHTGPAPGAVEAKCSSCGETILLARCSQERLARGYTAYCIQCIENGALRDLRLRVELLTTAELMDAAGATEKN